MGYLYIIRSGRDNVYKIGITRNDVRRRVKQLQTGNPNTLYLVKAYKLKQYASIERRVHKALELRNIRGEWFRTDLQTITRIIEKERKGSTKMGIIELLAKFAMALMFLSATIMAALILYAYLMQL